MMGIGVGFAVLLSLNCAQVMSVKMKVCTYFACHHVVGDMWFTYRHHTNPIKDVQVDVAAAHDDLPPITAISVTLINGRRSRHSHWFGWLKVSPYKLFLEWIEKDKF